MVLWTILDVVIMFFKFVYSFLIFNLARNGRIYDLSYKTAILSKSPHMISKKEFEEVELV
jgi:hypothetical protein